MTVGMLIESRFDYATISIDDISRETVDAFATEQCQMTLRFLYWDIL